MCRQHADGIFNYLDSSLTDTHETHACFVGILTQNDNKTLQCPILLGAGHIYKLKTGKMPVLNLWRTHSSPLINKNKT